MAGSREHCDHVLGPPLTFEEHGTASRTKLFSAVAPHVALRKGEDVPA